MATDVERLLVRLEAQATSFEREMARARQSADRQTRAIERRFEETNRAISQKMQLLSSTVAGGFGRLAGAAAGLVSVGALKGYADDWQGAINKIAAANNTLVGSQQRASQLTDIAIRSFGDLATTADLYAGLTRSTKDMGASQAQVLAVTETLNKAFAIGGQSAATQAGAITQLNQALAAGKLSGDEFNSVAEGAPIIMELLAQKLGVTRGALKELASEGKITSKVMVEALLEGGAAIEEQFSKLTPTIEQSLGRLRSAVTRYFGEIASDARVMEAVGRGTQFLLDNLDTAMRLAAVAAITMLTAFTPVGASIRAAAAALALFGNEIAPVAGQVASLADYARAAFETIQQAGGQAMEAFSASIRTASDALVSMFGTPVAAAGESLASLGAIVKDVLNGVIGAFVAAGNAIVASWNGVGPAIAETIFDAMNAVVRMVNEGVAKIIGSINSITGAVGIPAIPVPNFSGVENAYKGAGAKAATAFKDSFNAIGVDYLGNLSAGIDGVLARIKTRANEIGEARKTADLLERVRRQNAAPADGDINAPLRDVPQKGAGGGGGGGGGAKENEFQKALADLEKRVTGLNREREALALNAFEAAKAAEAHKLMDAAKSAGIPITEELRGKIDQLAGAYATVKQGLDDARKSQEEFKQLQQFVGQSLSGFFSDIVSGGKNASDALMNMTKKLADAAFQAALLGQGPLASLFGTASSEKGGVGGLLGGLFSAFGGSSGGGAAAVGAPLSIRPPGLAVGTSNVPQDMLAMIHKGEMVIPRYDADLLRKGQVGGAAGGTIEVVLSASPELDARIGRVSEGVSVRVTRQAIATNNRMLPGMLAENQAR